MTNREKLEAIQREIDLYSDLDLINKRLCDINLKDHPGLLSIRNVFILGTRLYFIDSIKDIIEERR